MNSLGSYLAAKAAQSKPVTPQRQSPAENGKKAVSPTSPTKVTASYPPAPQRAESLISASDALSIITGPAPSSLGRGPLVTSPTPTSGNVSPRFSPMRGLWGSSTQKPVSTSGGLLDNFDFEFDGLSGGTNDWDADLEHGEERASPAADWKFGKGGAGRNADAEIVRPPPSEVARGGWLWTQLTLNWKKVYGILTYKNGNMGIIHLYENEDDSQPFRIVELSTCTEVEACKDANTFMTGRYEFRLRMSSRQDAVFAAESGVDRSQWIASLKMLLPRAHTPGMHSPMPLPSAPQLDQLVEDRMGEQREADEEYYEIPRRTSDTTFAQAAFHGYARRHNATVDSEQPSQLYSPTGQDIRTEIVNVKDLLLKLLDVNTRADTSTDVSERYIELRSELTKLSRTFEETSKGIATAVQDLKHAMPPKPNETSSTTELETAVVELTDSMEIRTSKIAKMVHELLQKDDHGERIQAGLEDLKTLLKEALTRFSGQHANASLGQNGSLEASIASLNATVHSIAQSFSELQLTLSTPSEQSPHLAEHLAKSSDALNSISGRLEGLYETQHQHSVDMGMLMGMLAESNQKAALKQTETMSLVRDAKGGVEEMKVILQQHGSTVIERIDSWAKNVDKTGAGQQTELQSVVTNMREELSTTLQHLREEKSGSQNDAIIARIDRLCDAQENTKQLLIDKLDPSTTQELLRCLEKLDKRTEVDNVHIRDSLLTIERAVKMQNEGYLTKNDIQSISDTLEDVKARLSSALLRPPPSPKQTSGDRLDRPTTNMITSINDKLIHLSKLIDHVQETQTARFYAVEDRLKALPSASSTASTTDESATDAMLQQHKLTDIRNSLESIEERLSRSGREGQSRHDVVDGRLDRMSDQLKHMQRTLTKLVQVGMLGDNDSPSVDSRRSDNPTDGNLASSLADHRGLLMQLRQELIDVKEQLGDDVTGERMNDLLGMFSISQDTHNVVAGKIDAVLNEMVTKDVLEELKKQIQALGASAGNGVGGDVRELKEMMSEMTSQIQNLRSGTVGGAPQQTESTLPTILRLTESIHSCLVAYLPIDLDTKLSNIQSSLASARPQAYCPPPQPQQITPPRQADLRDLLTFHQDLARRELATTEALDSIQHSLARMLDCFDAHGLLQTKVTLARPATAPQVMEITELKEIKEAILSLQRAVSRPDTSEPTSSKDLETTKLDLTSKINVLNESIQQLQVTQDTIAAEIDAMLMQRTMLVEQIGGLEAKRYELAAAPLNKLNRAGSPRRPKSRQSIPLRRISCPVRGSLDPSVEERVGEVA
ncbi:uncharacterized protein SPPG_01530 [Spizellomyces punctatus DAOM BR117]|uniref:PH domain-containing protein n=1 Tax=Spizellomyces punctatus (strain DAOM BR117) TaxID=645134 RepID=A0A0L0HSL3_SPIPD|nr:uncharacterized protein SPPG_01530 [Spizellomyces punctatus DAOM BR117]KND04088.1 hypothetical protein SPPG_01530 [Spizellomyces punctatus DAOM BR117]|eukprot:XP_016612127.1 hypothetical protein SPPG_01530 [Spizellomyces punctatus DAOM BR117]